MVDLTTIEEKINFGSGIAARVIGQAVTQYRAQNIQSPLDISGYVAIFYAAFDSDPLLTLKKPIKVGRDVFYMIANTSTLAVGDYIVGPEGTFFVASLEPMRPPVVIRTNAVLSLVRPQSTSVAGLGPPGADSASTETTVFSGWPASVLMTGRGGQGDVNLPGDIGMGGWQILLPALFGIEIRGSDILVEATGLRRVVSAAELSSMGWRIDVVQETA
jgi:hypothetical protein